MHIPGALLLRQISPDVANGNQVETNPPPPPGGSAKTTIMPIIISVIVAVLALGLAIFFIRHARINHKTPKYIPTPFLKKIWTKWEPGVKRQRLPDTNEHLEPISATRQTGNRRSQPPPVFDAAAQDRVENAAGAAAGVDRNTSVRSVMTLPAYNPSARENEQVLAREGERGGIDVVIEFPGEDEQEEAREREMEALYQVRLARRRENEAREERRRLRREARERGDTVALREIAERQRASSTASAGQTVAELRAEHERIKKERQRAVSSVSYADLGIARHDGTRLRANSHESEREGLLGDAASIAADSFHGRQRSASSIFSVDTVESGLPFPGLPRSRPGTPSTRRRSGQSQVDTANDRAGSSPEMIDHDDVPPNSPPGYENISLDTPQDEHRAQLEPPPDYSSPTVGRWEHRPEVVFPPAGGRRQSASSSRRSSALIGQLGADGRSTGSSSHASAERRTSRGVGGTPQLPSLRLASLPSIQVDPGSPKAGRATDERDVTDQRTYDHPEE